MVPRKGLIRRFLEKRRVYVQIPERFRKIPREVEERLKRGEIPPELKMKK